MSAVEKETIQCKRIGENVCRFRKSRRMTQDDLAREARLSIGHVSKIERMRLLAGISNFALLKIAEALDVPLCALMSDDETCPRYKEFSDAGQKGKEDLT